MGDTSADMQYHRQGGEQLQRNADTPVVHFPHIVGMTEPENQADHSPGGCSADRHGDPRQRRLHKKALHGANMGDQPSRELRRHARQGRGGGE